MPLVQTTATGSCDERSGHAAGGSPAHADAASPRSATTTAPRSGPGVPGSTTASTGAARSTMEATSAAPMRGLMPEVMAPRRSRAAYSTA